MKIIVSCSPRANQTVSVACTEYWKLWDSECCLLILRYLLISIWIFCQFLTASCLSKVLLRLPCVEKKLTTNFCFVLFNNKRFAEIIEISQWGPGKYMFDICLVTPVNYRRRQERACCWRAAGQDEENRVMNPLTLDCDVHVVTTKKQDFSPCLQLLGQNTICQTPASTCASIF